MPRVGSSRMRTRVSASSHLPMTTFCWLPPERVRTCWPMPDMRTPSCFAMRAAAVRWPLRSTSPERVADRRVTRPRFSCTEASSTSPWPLRSSGTSPIPALMAAGTSCRARRSPRTSTVPASYGSAPKTARATSVRPAPTSPARPTTSPACTSKLMSWKTPLRVSPRTDSNASPVSGRSRGYCCSMLRPTMSWTSSSSGVEAGTWSMLRPSRRTVTRSPSAAISSRWWVIKTIPTPSARSWRTIAKSLSTSSEVSTAVGSSMIRTRASRLSALAISTIWSRAMPSSRTLASGRTSTPTRRSSSAASRRIRPWSTSP